MLKLYLDTSVYGGYFDEEFEEATKPLFEKVRNKEFEIMQSNLIFNEINLSPERVKMLFQSIENPIYINIENEDRVTRLAEKYIEEGVVGQTSLIDCAHIATASIYEADLLISWNFKHMVNISKIAGYNTVNQNEGYKILEIRSPREI